MRKSAVNSKKLGIYYRFKVTGLNQNAFLEGLKRRKIEVFNIKQKSNKEMYLSVKYSDFKKLFAFSKELCYTIKRVKTVGLLSPLLFLSKNVGVIIGVFFFLFTLIFFDNMVLQVEYRGTGSVIKGEISRHLEEKGIRQYAFFNGIDLKNLSNEIVVDNPKLEFCYCSKKGSKLVIESALRKEDGKILSGSEYQIVSPFDGEILSMKVYRGTAVKSVGDKVKKGEVLVEGYVLIKENVIPTNVVASIVFLREFTYSFTSNQDNQEDFAIAYAENVLGESDILSPSVTKMKIADKFIYNVIIPYKSTIIKG